MFKDLSNMVVEWAEEKGILDSSQPTKQLGKLLEEVGELVAADSPEQEIDAVGDILVVLIIYCKMKNLDPETCLAVAYDEIKDRKGKMVNGIFVKEK
jgi:NTP pyrophosphatase (non-canonical NTP hydrolase)